MTEGVTTPTTEQPAPVAPVAAPAPAPAEPQPDLKETAETLLANVPDHLRGIIPDVEPAKQIQWFATAQKTGVFSTGAPVVPQTDSGKPTVTPVEPNLNDLPPIARMAAGYGQ